MNHWETNESFKMLLNSIAFVVCSDDWSTSNHKYLPKKKKLIAEAFYYSMIIRKKRNPEKLFIPKVILQLIIKYIGKLRLK